MTISIEPIDKGGMRLENPLEPKTTLKTSEGGNYTQNEWSTVSAAQCNSQNEIKSSNELSNVLWKEIRLWGGCCHKRVRKLHSKRVKMKTTLKTSEDEN
jgi:hypothetical protein